MLLCGSMASLRLRPPKSRAVGAGIVWYSYLLLTIPTFLVLTVVLSLAFLAAAGLPSRGASLVCPSHYSLLGACWWRMMPSSTRRAFYCSTNGVNLLWETLRCHCRHRYRLIGGDPRYTAVGHQMPEPERNEYYSDSAKQWVKENLEQALRLTAPSCFVNFRFLDKTAADESQHYLVRR